MNTRNKRYSGGPGQLDPGRNRLTPTANDQGNGQGQRARNAQEPLNEEQDETHNADVAEAAPQPTTLQGRPRQRTKWTNAMNEFLYGRYLVLSELETKKTGYSIELHAQMTKQFPELARKTVQNILDQRRVLLTSKVITTETAQRIRIEAEIELGVRDQNENQPPVADADVNVIDEDQAQVREKFEEIYIRYNGTTPEMRPRIPKLKTNRNTNRTITLINNTIAEKINNAHNLLDLHTIIYVGAMTAIEINKKNSQNPNKVNSTPIESQPPWERRLIKRIEELRKHIGQIEQAMSNTASEKLKRKAKKLTNKYKNENNNTNQEILDLLKQQLAARAKRLRRFKESRQRRQDNHQFKDNEGRFYRQLKATTNNNEDEQPDKDDTKSYWKNIWAVPKQHRKKAKWITKEKERMTNKRRMINHTVELEEVEKVIKRSKNWKAPGIDKIQNFWIKKFKSTHNKIGEIFTDILEDRTELPTFMTQGITYLLSKTSPTSKNPSKYRPITCLPTLYKLLTGVIAEKIYKHLTENELLATEQKGCTKSAKGCKDQLVIDAIITGNAKKEKKDLFTAYIDYQKAFDSVPHTWLLEVLELYKIDQQIIKLLGKTMNTWKTTLTITAKNKQQVIGDIPIQCGIFQGDALSPLWFCLALNPLSSTLKEQNKGVKLGDNRVLTHLLYMDDLKTYASSDEDLEKNIQLIKRFSEDINMTFGLDKCRINVMEKGKWRKHQGVEMGEEAGVIEGMEQDELYKYLGYQQARGIDQKQAKEHLRGNLRQRLKMIMRTKLRGKNMVKAINTYAIPILTYSFGIISWTQTEITELNRTIRTVATKHRLHHPRSSVERFHLPREQGGRGVLNIEELHQKQIRNLRSYFHRKAEETGLYRAIVNKDNKITPLNLQSRQLAAEEPTNHMEKWLSKELHGRYPALIKQNHINEKASLDWLRKGHLFPETEGFVMAIQDQVVPTRNYQRYIMKQHIETDKCRMCGEQTESIDHIVSGCTVLAPNEYTKRHDNVGKIIYQEFLKKIKPDLPHTPYYKLKPDSVIENENYKLYWNREIITDVHIPHNKPDMVLVNKQTKQTYIIDMAIPLPTNTQRKHREKINKYLPLANEIKDMWSQDRVTIVPIIFGATGEVPSATLDGLKTLEIKEHLLSQMQKITLIETTGIVRKVLNLP